MNLAKPLRSMPRLFHMLGLRLRFILPRQVCRAFSDLSGCQRLDIGSIYVINLDRQPSRFVDMVRELGWVLDAGGEPLSNRLIRYSACDAQSESSDFSSYTAVDQSYTLADQLFVEPQLNVLPGAFDLNHPIKMTPAEVAIAHSHIGVWKVIAKSDDQYAMVLEDDVWFTREFGRTLERAWTEAREAQPDFDLLYVSYEEARYGAPKELISSHLFRPERGLWFLSGYVLSKKGAQALLDRLPCRGPVDLWINYQFKHLRALALRRAVVNQRRDLHSTNVYSILPTLSRIGVINDGDASLFRHRPRHFPVFAFGSSGAGLSSLAMALSMLGYRCCSDFDDIPSQEIERLFDASTRRTFDAYVNIHSLREKMHELARLYPSAKFIWVDDDLELGPRYTEAMGGMHAEVDVLHLHQGANRSWRALCDYLELAPPIAPYPWMFDGEIQKYDRSCLDQTPPVSSKQHLRHDLSPWVARLGGDWGGIPSKKIKEFSLSRLCFQDDFSSVVPSRWLLRDDTFPSNLALFRPGNVTTGEAGLSLSVIRQALGVRGFSAAAISSLDSYLYGRFEALFRATDVPGMVTGFFLHRNSPRQEIDVEIMGNRPNQLLVNVFYNPGRDGDRFDYGYRGTPAIIDLGFDASSSLHRFTIEWDPCEIRWFVDEKLVHRRVTWGPTPIPNLPMTLHFNLWPARSRELAGRLAVRALPASAVLRQVAVYTHDRTV